MDPLLGSVPIVCFDSLIIFQMKHEPLGVKNLQVIKETTWKWAIYPADITIQN